MSARTIRAAIVGITVVALGWAQAFQWAPFEFGPGDQGYTLEIRAGGSIAAIVDVDMIDHGDGFDVTSRLTFELKDVALKDLGTAMFGGQSLLLFGLGPMILLGPSFLLLPLVLGDEEIRVRSEPIRVLGIGWVHMEREEFIAGHRCVFVRFAPDADPEGPIEFAVAEGLPVPCFSRWGSGPDRFEMRLLRAYQESAD